MNIKQACTLVSAFVMTAGLVACDPSEPEIDVEAEDFLLVEEIAGDNPDCGLRTEILESADTNGDGVLDEEERRAYREAKRAELLAAYDADGDGRLNAEERQAARDGRRADRFASLDLDGSGGLTADELEGVCRLGARFASLDADGDGVVTLEEFSMRRWGRRGRR